MAAPPFTALMAVAGPASATSVTTTTGGAAATPTIHLVNEGGHTNVLNSVALVQCNMTLEGTVISHGTGKPTTISVSTLTFTGCTNQWHVTTKNTNTATVTGGNPATLDVVGSRDATVHGDGRAG